MDKALAAEINDNLAMGFNHLRNAIMLAIAGFPEDDPEVTAEDIGGAVGRLQRFIDSDGDVEVLMEGLFDEAAYEAAREKNPDHDNQHQTEPETIPEGTEIPEGEVAVDEPNLTPDDNEFTPEEIAEIEGETEDDDSSPFDEMFEIEEEEEEAHVEGEPPAAF